MYKTESKIKSAAVYSNAAIYTRVSTPDQVREGFSLNAQRELLLKFAKDHSYSVCGEYEYEDGGYSGAITERPALQQLLQDAREGKFSVLLVYKFDRFFRRNKFFLNTLDELEELGVAIKSVTEPFDSSTPMGKFMLNMIGGMAELERNTIIERSKMGRQRRYKEGFYAGGTETKTKYGYNYDKDKNELTINEEEAKVLRFVFEEYTKPDSSIVKVTRKLRKLGIKTKTGLNFESDRVQQILRSTMYSGVWYANQHSDDKELKKRENWIAVKVPNIVEQEVFDKAQHLLDQRRTYTRREMKYDYLLQGMITCGSCGCTVKGTADKQMTVKNGKKYGPYLKLYYRCTYRLKNTLEEKINCGLRYIQAALLEKLVWGKIEDILKNPALIEKAIKSKTKIKTKDKDLLIKELNKAKRKISKLDNEEQRLIEAYRHNILNMEQIKTQLDEIKTLRQDTLKEIEHLQLKHDSYNTGQDVAQAKDYVSKIKKGLKKFSFDSKRKTLQLLNTKLTVNINGIVDLFLTLPKISIPKGKSFSPLLSAGPIFWPLVVFMLEWLSRYL